ncbi:MAG: hypothetical protein V4494_06935 [Chlamydiota bacterium]
MASQQKIDRAPSAETLIQWELKIGLYKLERPKPTDGGWIWMADHVIRLGVYKCFVIVGVRMATLLTKKDLTVSLEDLEPIALLPMETSNGTEVARKLEKTVQKVGFSPDALVIDHGSDLYAGARRFCENHPRTQLKYDVCHKVACELKKRLNKNLLWEKMTSGAVQTKKALSLSKFAKFAPPQQRSKARYMNLDSLVKWACAMLAQYDTLPKEVQRKVAWLIPMKREVHKWQEWVQIGQVTRDQIRREGFYDGADEALMDRLIAMNLTSEETEEFTEALVDYVRSEGEGVHRDNRVVGTTEVLEGLFGGYKRMVGENKMSLNGLGRLILCMSSRIGEFSEELVYKAMTNIKCKDVNAWLEKAFMKPDKKFLEQNQEQLLWEKVCNF